MGRDRGEGALARLNTLVAEDLAACNRLIIERMHSPVALIPQLAAHIVAAGGKRLRPLLTLASSHLCGYSGERHVALAACVEFIHTATLLHDDVVDESALRRGQASANALFGNKASVLVGDFLFARAFQLMIEDKSLEVLRILATASATIAEGEVLQLITQNDLSSTEAQYLEVIEGKTAALFAAATRLGAVVAERPLAEAEALDAYGRNLGIAFQLVDDALDYAAEQAAIGKTVGDDFREGKITLPVILAWRRGTADERLFWREAIEGGKNDDANLERASGLITKYGSLTDTIGRANHYGTIARDALAPLPASPWKDALMEVIDFCIGRVN